MVTTKMNFRFMKRLARGKIKILRRARQEPRVTQAINALQRSIELLDDCTGMGFQIAFPSKLDRLRAQSRKRTGRG